jgi:predicted Zn-ribbon and HTH transcriptional regulator
LRKITSHKKQSKALKKKRKDKERQKKAKEYRDIQKQIAKRVKAIENMISQVPSSCTSCGTIFNNKDDDHLDKWNMKIEGSDILLACDKCTRENNEPEES